MITSAEQALAARYEALASGNVNAVSDGKLILIIIQQPDIVASISSNTTVMNAYKNIIGKYKNMHVGIIIGGIENEQIPFNAPEILKKIKEQKHFMFFDDLALMKPVEIPLTVARAFKKKVELGDGYYMKDNMVVKLKTPLWEEE